MNEIVRFTLDDKTYCITELDVTKWDLTYSNTGVVVTLYGYQVTEQLRSVSNVCVGEHDFTSFPARIGTVEGNTKIIILRRQFRL